MFPPGTRARTARSVAAVTADRKPKEVRGTIADTRCFNSQCTICHGGIVKGIDRVECYTTGEMWTDNPWWNWAHVHCIEQEEARHAVD
jgi:hypothetical protein